MEGDAVNWSISTWAIRNPAPPILLFVVLCALGIFAFMGLPQMRYPSADVPLVHVTIGIAGMSPSDLETQVTKKLENAVAALSGD